MQGWGVRASRGGRVSGRSPWVPSLLVLLVVLAALFAPSAATGRSDPAALGAAQSAAVLEGGAARVAAAQCPLLGDINCDGIVDLLDYGLWRQAFGATDCGNPADLNLDCLVDIRDYGVWRQNFGHTAATATATPTGTLLA